MKTRPRYQIAAFLQNPWFKPGTRGDDIDLYTHWQPFHRRVLAMSMSGRRLMNALGPDLYRLIWWDNANPRPAFNSAGSHPPDMDHIRRVVKNLKPDLIICVGKTAYNAIAGQTEFIRHDVIEIHHPNARGKTMEDLRKLKIDVELWMQKRHISYSDLQAPERLQLY